MEMASTLLSKSHGKSLAKRMRSCAAKRHQRVLQVAM